MQEEPANQGAWPTFGLTMPEVLPEKLTGIKRISRRAMSAPSSGSSKVHAVEQQEIIDEAFGRPTGRSARDFARRVVVGTDSHDPESNSRVCAHPA